MKLKDLFHFMLHHRYTFYIQKNINSKIIYRQIMYTIMYIYVHTTYIYIYIYIYGYPLQCITIFFDPI